MANLTAEQQALLDAIKEREFITVKKLLADGVSPDFTNEHGLTPMMVLAAQEWSETRRENSGSIRAKYEDVATTMMSHIPANRRRAYVNTFAKIGENFETAIDICGYESGVGKVAKQYGGMTKTALEAEAARREAERAKRAQSAPKKTPQPAAPAVEPQPQPQEPTKHPSIWERYAPTLLGGWSQEEVKKYDDAMKAVGKERAPNFWDRHAPTWLAGWDQERVEAYDASRNNQQKSDKTEVFKGVTVDELKEAGYSDEKIRQMQDMVRNKVQEHQANQGGAAALLGKHAEPVRLTMEDYQSIGLDRNDAIKLSVLARNDEGR